MGHDRIVPRRYRTGRSSPRNSRRSLCQSFRRFQSGCSSLSSSHLDLQWEQPACACFLTRLSSFSRAIVFDKRGTGLSDRVHNPPTLEERSAHPAFRAMPVVEEVCDRARSDSDRLPKWLQFGAVRFFSCGRVSPRGILEM
jgi:hypothetical protein